MERSDVPRKSKVQTGRLSSAGSNLSRVVEGTSSIVPENNSGIIPEAITRLTQGAVEDLAFSLELSNVREDYLPDVWPLIDELVNLFEISVSGRRKIIELLVAFLSINQEMVEARSSVGDNPD